LVAVERALAQSINIAWDYYRQMRDATQELAFNCIYANPWVQTMFRGLKPEAAAHPSDPATDNASQQEMWQSAMQTGGFQEAVVRIILAVMSANRRFDRIQLQVAGKILKVNEHFKDMSPSDLKRISRQQAVYLSKNKAMALAALADLLPGHEARVEAYEIANSIATSDLELETAELDVLQQIKTILDV
jgi:hypothetical protein